MWTDLLADSNPLQLEQFDDPQCSVLELFFVTRGVARNLFRGRTKEVVPFPAGEPRMGSGCKVHRNLKKHAEHSVECHKFCTV